MYCSNCGNEVREGAKFCDKCGCTLPYSKKTNKLIVFLIILSVFIIIGVIVQICLIATSMKKDNSVNISKETTTSVSTSFSSSDSESANSDSYADTGTNNNTIENKDSSNSQPTPLLNLFSGESKLGLPSLVSFSKERMSLGDYHEEKSAGGFVQIFDAGNDTSVINCIAEYKDILPAYGVTVTGTLSSTDGTYNYTCYLCSYSGGADIQKQKINFNDSGICDLCFVTASGNGKAYIAAYVPDGVSFEETTDHMRNSY